MDIFEVGPLNFAIYSDLMYPFFFFFWGTRPFVHLLAKIQTLLSEISLRFPVDLKVPTGMIDVSKPRLVKSWRLGAKR